MKLCTPVNIPKPNFALNVDSVITGIGSCFAEYAMKQLEELGLNVAYNPNGIVYNSHSIKTALEHILEKKDYLENNFIFYNELWHSWNHHGSFSCRDLKKLKGSILTKNINFKNALKKAGAFILTPSSSVVYCLKENDMTVANCHKYPGNKFYTKTLSTEENFKNLSTAISLIQNYSPACQIIITLSPVRHYPGNLILNARSKANLLSAIHNCIKKHSNIYYFPSYEILLDELRDYRFFNEDMLHPTELARKIIIEKFIATFFTKEAIEKLEQNQKELKKNQHRTNSKKVL